MPTTRKPPRTVQPYTHTTRSTRSSRQALQQGWKGFALGDHTLLPPPGPGQEQVLLFLWDTEDGDGVGGLDSRSIWAGMCKRAEGQSKHPPAFTTVMTHLKRLVQRGLVKRTGQLREYIFEAAVSRDEYEGWLHEETLNRLVLPAVKRLMVAVGTGDFVLAIEMLGYRVTAESEPSTGPREQNI